MRDGIEEELVIQRRIGRMGAATLAAVAVAWVGCGGTPSPGSGIELPTFASLEDARTHAVENGTPVLLDFYTDW